MYDDKMRETIINDLERKINSITETAITLASQGYFINKVKYTRLDWSSVLIHAFENIDILNKSQQDNIELIYNQISKL